MDTNGRRFWDVHVSTFAPQICGPEISTPMGTNVLVEITCQRSLFPGITLPTLHYQEKQWVLRTTISITYTTLFTSKNLRIHHTCHAEFPATTPNWKMLHHFTLEFVLSAVFLWFLSLMIIYSCSSWTW